MNLGERLLNLRKKEHLSQEEVAFKLNVSRQTISKWETDQSTPDFDKIAPLCELYGITADELLTGKKEKIKEEKLSSNKEEIAKKRAKGIGIGVLCYFIAITWIMISVPVLMLNPVIASAVFLLISGIATFFIVYTCIVYKEEKTEKEKKEKKLIKQIDKVLSLITLIIYLFISFTTMAWHITWLIWIVYALIMEIIKLIISIRGDEDEK